jgi:hypothetical protein
MEAEVMGILQLLNMLIGLGSLVCLIYVLVKQFQNGGAVHGIIGIVTCGIWTFIWGWINSSKVGIKNIMLIWTGLAVLSIVLTIAGGGFSYSYQIGTNP